MNKASAKKLHNGDEVRLIVDGKKVTGKIHGRAVEIEGCFYFDVLVGDLIARNVSHKNLE